MKCLLIEHLSEKILLTVVGTLLLREGSKLTTTVKLMFSETERLFRIVHDQGDGTVATYVLETDANYQEDSSKKFIEKLWIYISDQRQLKIANLNIQRRPKGEKGKVLTRENPHADNCAPQLSPTESIVSSPVIYTYTRESTPEAYYIDSLGVVDDYLTRESYDRDTFDDFGLDDSIHRQILVELFQLRSKLKVSESENVRLRNELQHFQSLLPKVFRNTSDISSLQYI